MDCQDRVRLAFVALCCMASVPVASAADGSIRMSAGIGYSDNAARVSNNADDQSFADLSLGASIVQQGARYAAGLNGAMSYQEFLSGGAGGDLLGQMSGNLQYQIVPGRLQWKVRDDISQYRVNLQEADAPGNRALINNFDTGPELTLMLGERSPLALSGSYGRTWDEQGVVGSSQYSGSASLGHQWTAGQSLSLVGSIQKLDFEDDDPSFESRDLGLAYVLNGARTSLNLQVGHEEIDDTDGTKASLRATMRGSRRVTPRLTLAIGFDYRFSHSQASLREVTDDLTQLGDNDLIIVTQSAFRNRTARAAVQYERGRTTIEFLTRYSSPQYRQQPEFNRRFLEAGARLTRDIGQRSVLEIKTTWLRARYKFVSLDNDEGIISAGWSKRAGRSLFFRLDAQHSFRNRPDNLSEYTESRVMFSVGLQAGSGV